MKFALSRRKLDLTRCRELGQGGEAIVYDVGGGMAAKVFKQPDHPDYEHSADAQAAARHRITEHQTKLRAFPKQVPPRVVAPASLIEENGTVIGYTMPLLDQADVLLRYSDRRFRAGVPDDAVVAIFRDLHATTLATHRAGIVIGDFNDLNVLVRAGVAWLIDADSMQYGSWPCRAFTERFLDPRLAVANAKSPVLNAIYDRDADWYAFTCMLMEALLFVGPFGGVFRPRAASSQLPHAARSLHGITIFHPEVRYPKPARPWAVLPDDLLEYFRAVFERRVRGEFPLKLLDALRWTRCTKCNAEHARAVCPSCQQVNPAAVREVRQVRGNVIAIRVAQPPAAAAGPRVRLADGALWREDTTGAARIGSVADGTEFWVGPAFGFGYYRIRELTVAFVFDGKASGLYDGVRVQRIAGQLIDAHAVLSDQLCWFFTRTQERAQTVQRVSVVHRNGTVLATAVSYDGVERWWAGARGACAAGDQLFVPTDDGVVRLSVDNGVVHESAHFPGTDTFVNAGVTLQAAADGLYVIGGEHVIRLQLRGGAG